MIPNHIFIFPNGRPFIFLKVRRRSARRLILINSAGLTVNIVFRIAGAGNDPTTSSVSTSDIEN